MEKEGRLMDAAKVFLLAYFADGETRQPTDFDRDILGVDCMPAVLNIIRGTNPAWNDTIFCEALSQLIDEEKVQFWIDADKGYMYRANPYLTLVW